MYDGIKWLWGTCHQVVGFKTASEHLPTVVDTMHERENVLFNTSAFSKASSPVL